MTGLAVQTDEHTVDVREVSGVLTFGWAPVCSCGWSMDYMTSAYAAWSWADEHERTGE